jgi:acyl carrier protein
MDNLLAAVRNTFPNLPVEKIRPATRLSELPNWDSMTAVNLLMEVATSCGTELKNFEPSDTMTLAELAEVIAADGGKP